MKAWNPQVLSQQSRSQQSQWSKNQNRQRQHKRKTPRESRESPQSKQSKKSLWSLLHLSDVAGQKQNLQPPKKGCEGCAARESTCNAQGCPKDCGAHEKACKACCLRIKF